MLASTGIIARLPQMRKVYTMVWKNTAVTCWGRDELTQMLRTIKESHMSLPDVILYWNEKDDCSLHSVKEFLDPGPLASIVNRRNIIRAVKLGAVFLAGAALSAVVMLLL